MGSLFSAIFSLGIVVPEHKIEEEAFKLAIGQSNGVRSGGKMPYYLRGNMGHTPYAHFDGAELTQQQILVPVLTVSPP